MDRETLAIRNQGMAEAFHQKALKHRLRNGILKVVAKAPVIRQNSDAKRVLIIRPDHLGDMLLTTAAIQAIKRDKPDIGIHVLCGEWCADLLANYDEIDQVLTLPFPGFQRDASSARNPYLLALQSARMLRQIGYDSAIIMRPDHWWGAMLAFLAGIRQRIGYDLDGVAPFLTDAHTLRHQHAVEQNLRLAGSLVKQSDVEEVRLKYPLSDDDREYIENHLSDWDIRADQAVVCIHPGSGASSKIWCVEKWANAADAISSQYEAAIVFSGTPSESALIGEIAAKMKQDAYIIAGSTIVGQLAALYRRSLAVLGPDSGAMHLAAAVHTPTVTLFGPADPIEFAPWGDSRRHAIVTSNIGCRPCRILDWRDDNPDFHPCVRDITVSQVLDATQSVLHED